MYYQYFLTLQCSCHSITHQTSDLVVKMKYMSDSSAIHLAGSGRGLEVWCLYMSEYKCLYSDVHVHVKYVHMHTYVLTYIRTYVRLYTYKYVHVHVHAFKCLKASLCSRGMGLHNHWLAICVGQLHSYVYMFVALILTFDSTSRAPYMYVHVHMYMCAMLLLSVRTCTCIPHYILLHM